MRLNRKRRWLLQALGYLSLVGVLAACSSGDETSFEAADEVEMAHAIRAVAQGFLQNPPIDGDRAELRYTPPEAVHANFRAWIQLDLERVNGEWLTSTKLGSGIACRLRG